MKCESFYAALVMGLIFAPLLHAGDANADAVELKQGVTCDRDLSAVAGQATHACYFDPAHVGKRDFSSRNGRAEYIFTVLGPECGEMEILADEDFSAPDGRAVALKRVMVVCTE